MHKVIIVGAGFAGLQAAKGLSNSEFDVTIIDKNNYHLFQPLLYQVATAGLSPSEIAIPIRNIFRSQNNLKVILDELIGIKPQFNKIITKNNIYSYDFLILATGSELSYFGNDQWKKFSHGLKNIEDASFISGVCKVPSLFIRGGDSDYINDNDVILLKKHFSDFSIKTIEKAGHWLHAEQPQVFYDEVISFNSELNIS